MMHEEMERLRWEKEVGCGCDEDLGEWGMF